MHYKNRSQGNILIKRGQAEPQIYTVIVTKTRIDITQKKSREMLQIDEKSPASSPILTVKTAGLIPWPAGLFLKFNYTKMIHNTYPCYSSNDQKNVLLSNATPIGVHKMHSADCTQVVLDCRFSTRLDRQIFLHS